VCWYLADAILRAASRMDGTIEDLLDGARLESGRLRLELEKVELVSVSMPESARITVRADPRRLERVLLNLISNALKYCPGGKVRLEVTTRVGWVAIAVADDGPGIHPEDLPHLFTRYYRGRGTPSREGLGLGLYGARALVEAHGGRIHVETSPGAGTRFRVELPGVAPGPPG
jgi:signal transduction histidine kinase